MVFLDGRSNGVWVFSKTCLGEGRGRQAILDASAQVSLSKAGTEGFYSKQYNVFQGAITDAWRRFVLFTNFRG